MKAPHGWAFAAGLAAALLLAPVALAQNAPEQQPKPDAVQPAQAPADEPQLSKECKTPAITIRGDVIGRQTGAELVREINSALKAGYKLNLDWV